ncbi:MAG: high-potential iron-sulfur protein [Burkholderiales bacterium]|jgi:hypothetical protein|nr:high-potential iron-sulfur protein [Burkholderiales bacterium]
MSEMQSRRRFIRLTVAGASALPLAGLVGTAHAQAKVDPNSPQAKGLQYVVDATKAPGRKDPKHFCDNCALYTAKGPNEGACSAFAGGLVAAKGWCAAWAPMPAKK